MPRHRITLTIALAIVIAGSFLPLVSSARAGAPASEEADAFFPETYLVNSDRLPGARQPISLDIEDLPVADLPDLLRKLGLELDVADTLPERTITIHAENEPLDRVLARIGSRAGLRFEVADNGVIRVIPILLGGMDGVTNPKLISKVEPAYPDAARRDRAEGTVILQATIDEWGDVRDVKSLRASPDSQEFVDAAIEAVRQWRYEPATKDGQAVAVYFTIFIEFRLGDGPSETK